MSMKANPSIVSTGLIGTGDRACEGPAWNVAAEHFEGWRRGNAVDLDALVRLLTPILWHVTRAYGVNRATAEDVVQATWLALVRKPESVRDPQAVFRWLTTAARREAWRCAREARREEPGDSEVIEAAAETVAGPEGRVLASVAARSLWRLVAHLSDRCQRLLRVIAFADRPNYASLASELGMAIGAIGPTRMRCLKKLRELMADDPEWAEK